MKMPITFALCICAVASGWAVAGDVGIHSMVLGRQALELVDNRQLTFHAHGEVKWAWISPSGRWVVYATERPGESTRLSLIASSGKGRPRTIWESQIIEDPKPGDEFWLVGRLGRGTGLAWSPDSRRVALPVHHVAVVPGGVTEHGIAILDVTRRKPCPPPPLFFPVTPDGHHWLESLVWSLDSRTIAGNFTVYGKQDEAAIFLFDLSQASARRLFAFPRPVGGGTLLDLEGWTGDGKSVLISMYEENDHVLRKVPVAGGEPVVIEQHYDPGERSPDRLFRHMVERSREGISIENCTTGETVEISKSPNTRFLGWSPNSKMFAYRRSETISDEVNQRTKTLSTLWLGCVETHKLNHMCVALDSDCWWDEELTWSPDCSKMAYVRDGRACVAEFTWRPPTSREKLAAGIPLAEDEYEKVLARSAKQIGNALEMYRDDQEGRVPTSETVMQDLLPYLKQLPELPIDFRDMFGMFQYFPPPPLDQIRSPAETIVGLMDAGYDWQIVLYADGHVGLIAKQ